MATKKTVKKAVSKAKAPIKKTVKKTVKKVAARVKKPAPMQSFRVYKDPTPFTTFRITRQTVYWSILLAFIIATQLWILKIQMDISALTDALLAQ